MENGKKPRARILIAEDEAIIAKDLQSSLTDVGYKVLEVTRTGEQVVEMAKTLRPDLVLMDIVLEGKMDGIEAAQKIHDRFNIPVMFLTGYADEDKMERAKGAEPYAYILKPFKIKELEIAIELALYKHRIGYYAIFEHTGTATCIINGDKTLSLVNTEFEKLSDYSREELEGKKKWSDFVAEEDLARMQKYHEERRKKGGKAPQRYEFGFIDRQKNIKNILLSIGMIPNTKKSIASLLDITERRQAEEALRQSEEKANKYLDIVGSILISLDRKGEITMLNKKGYKVLGYKEGSLIGKNWFETCLPKKIAPEIKKVFRKIMTGKIKSLEKYENDIITKKGDHRLIRWHNTILKDDKGKVIGLLSSGQDITRQKEAEIKLKESEERLSKAVQVATDLIYEWNVEDDKLEWFGDIDKTLGYEKGTIPRTIKGWLRLIHPDDRPDLQEAVKIHREATKKISYEYRIKNNKGEWNCWIDNALPILNKKGKPVRWVGTCTDITGRRKAEEALNESEARFRAIFNKANDGILLADLKEKKFKYANPAISRLLGYPKSELLVMGVADIHPKKDLPFIIEQFKKQARGEINIAPEIPCMCKDGRVVYADISTTLLELNGIQYNVGFFRDVTEKRETEKKLQENAQKYRTIFENTGTAMCIIEADKTLSLVNSKFSELSGYSKKEIEGKKKWVDFVTKEHLARMKKYHEERRKKGGKAPTEYEFDFIDKKRNQKSVFFTIHMVPGTKQSVASLLDITDRKKIEKSLAESEGRYRNVIENINDIVYMADTSGKVIFITPNVSRYGYTPDEIIDQPVTRFVHPDDLLRIQAEIEETFSTGLMKPSEFRLLKKDGSFVFVEDLSRRITDTDGSVRLLGTLRDVTDRRKAEDELKKKIEQMEFVGRQNLKRHKKMMKMEKKLKNLET